MLHARNARQEMFSTAKFGKTNTLFSYQTVSSQNNVGTKRTERIKAGGFSQSLAIRGYFVQEQRVISYLPIVMPRLF